MPLPILEIRSGLMLDDENHSAPDRLEKELQSILNHSTRQCGIKTPEPTRISEVVVRHRVGRLIENIEEFNAELHLQALSQSRVLKQRDISSDKARTVEFISSLRAEPDLRACSILYAVRSRTGARRSPESRRVHIPVGGNAGEWVAYYVRAATAVVTVAMWCSKDRSEG